MTPRTRLGLLAIAAIAAIAAPACRAPLDIFGGNARALVTAPRPVKSRVTAPTRPEARLAVLWVGHATALVQLDDKFILTDPVFTSTVGLLSRRLVEPGIDPAHLPPIDAVVISHMHFDHLSLGSLETIGPKVRHLFVPQGGLVYVPGMPFPTDELARWQSWEHEGLRITAAPVAHVGFRYGADQWMTTSFTGWVIEYHGLTVYFGGDTAYHGALFREARRRFPTIDLALFPIAPIAPREYMQRTHVDPPEALQAFLDLGARWFVPVHYDTFVNSSDAPGEAIRALEQARKDKGVDRAAVQVLGIGEQRVLVPR